MMICFEEIMPQKLRRSVCEGIGFFKGDADVRASLPASSFPREKNHGRRWRDDDARWLQTEACTPHYSFRRHISFFLEG
jgi:hypothetical protein